MPDRRNSGDRTHKLMTYARLTLIGLFALAVVALSVGLSGVRVFKEHVDEKTVLSCESIMVSLSEYVSYRAEEEALPTAMVFEEEYVGLMVDAAALKCDMSFCILDAEGKVLICSDNSGTTKESVTISPAVIKLLKTEGRFSSESKGKLNMEDSRPVLCGGSTFKAVEADGTETAYYLVVNSYLDDLENYTRSTLIAGTVSVLVMLIIYILFQMSYAKSYKNPETAIAKALRSYAQGDYSEELNPEDFNSPIYRDIVRSINQNVINVKATSEQQAQFVSNVSHELRTPMTIISGYVDGILDGTVPKEKRTEYLYIVSQEMQRLKILVSSMLNLTRFDNGTIQMKRENFVINDLIFRTILMFGNRIEKRNIEIEGLDCDSVLVYGDRDLIGQVVYNLTENAVKFVDTGGTISIRLEETKDASIFAIRNTGAGISKEELPKIFGRFYKSDFSRSQDKTGLGLGLDIIRKILKLHDAQISVSSEENVFTEFVVSFPKKKKQDGGEA